MLRRNLVALIATSALVAAASGANAADLAARSRPMPVKAAPVMLYDWNGFFVGGHIGGAWTDEHATYLSTTGTALDPAGTQYSGNRSGFLGGVQAGYNWQMQQLVFGIVGDWSWTSQKSDNATPGALIPGSIVDTQGKTRWYGTIAGRVGYAVNNVLLYAKGGAAFANEVYGGYGSAGGVTQAYNSLTTTRTGYVLGAGLEYGITPNWTAFAEYNYLDFGTKNITLSGSAGSSANFNVKDHVNVVKGGVNYKFNWGGPVVAKY